MIHSSPQAAPFRKGCHTHTVHTPSLTHKHTLIFNSSSQSEASVRQIAWQRAEETPSKPGVLRVQDASGRCPAGSTPESPGLGPASKHPKCGEKSQGRDFRLWGGGRRHRPQGHLLSSPDWGQQKRPVDPDLWEDTRW